MAIHEPPNEDFHIYLLDQRQEGPRTGRRSLQQDRERAISAGTPSISRPSKCPRSSSWPCGSTPRDKGVYLGMKKNVKQKHSYIGLPDKGYQEGRQALRVDDPGGGVFRKRQAADASEGDHLRGREGRRHGKYRGAARRGPGTTRPARSAWKRSSPASSTARSCSRRPTARSSRSPWSSSPRKIRISWPSKPAQSRRRRSRPPPRPANCRTTTARWPAKSSIAGGGHAVKFKVDGDSWYVTSVSLHGSRYGEARPPKENFKVWICDAQFKPIATFEFPYSSYTRGNPGWKSFRIRPTRVPAGLHRLLRLQSASDQRGLRQLRRQAEQNLDDRRSRRRRAEAFHQGQLADPLQGREARKTGTN